MNRLTIGTAALILIAISDPTQSGATSPFAAFAGDRLVAISDGDMLASAYVTGRLGPQEDLDALIVAAFDGEGVAVAATPVSNSVAGAPTAVAVTPDGRFAVVSESFGPRPAAAETFRDLPVGAALTLVDISNADAPAVVETIDIGVRPEGLSISPDGAVAAIALHPSDGRGIAFAPIEDGRFGPLSYALPPGVGPDQRLSHVEWRPSGDFIAIHEVDTARIHFARVERGDEGVALTAWGNPVLTSKYPFMGRFTPDGRHYLNGNLYWGPDVVGVWTEAPAGDVTAIRFADAAAEDGSVRHFLVGRAETGVSPEGVAISPDGLWAVTTNLEVSYAPADDPRHTPFASVTLIGIAPDTGRLTTVGTFAYDGVLPEAAVWNAASDHVAVVTFDQLEGGPAGGSIDLWRLVDGPHPRLVQTRASVATPHGPHSIVRTD